MVRKKLALLVGFMLVWGVWGADASASYYFKSGGGVKYYVDWYLGYYSNTAIYGLKIIHTDGSIGRGALLLDLDTWDLTITSFEDSDFWGYSIEMTWYGNGSVGYMVNSQGTTDEITLYFYSD
jgi:hypothetical protein